MSELDALIDEATPVSQPVLICTRGDLIGEHARLEAQLEQAQRDDSALNRSPEAPKVARKIAKLEQQMRDSAKELTVTAVGAVAWSEMLAAHEPTRKQRDEHPGLDHNPETFPFAAVAASLGEPDDGKVRKLAEKIGHGQWSQLWGACLTVNVGKASVPFSVRASLALRGSQRSGESAGSGESPDPTS
jgi:hypothetical protein